jgi:hypothetical protein
MTPDELGTKIKEVAMIYFKVPSQHQTGGTRENHSSVRTAGLLAEMNTNTKMW